MIELEFKHLFLDINLRAEDSFSILGPNGSGKSILLKVITHELYPQKLVKRNIFGNKLTLNEARKIFGVVNSDLEYFYKNEDITIYDAVISAFKEALVVYKFFDFTDYEKEKTEQLCRMFKINASQDVSTLSLGELKKVLIARALIHDPEIICLDEPTNGLDIKARYQFYDLIRELDKKLILITHNFDEVLKNKKIFMLKNGRIVKETFELKKSDLSYLFDIEEEKIRL